MSVKTSKNLSISGKRIIAALVSFIAAIVLAASLTSGVAFAGRSEEPEIVDHDPYKHAKMSMITQEFGEESVFIYCEYEFHEPVTHIDRVCEYRNWPLIVLEAQITFYDGKPKPARFCWYEMLHEPRVEHDGFPYQYADWDGKLIYSGWCGPDRSVRYGPTDKPPIEEGDYIVRADVRIPKASTLVKDVRVSLVDWFVIYDSSYDVHFDPNLPDTASTKDEFAGTMPSEHFSSFVEKKALYPNQYRLPGYEFDSWNMSPRGTLGGFKDNEIVSGLSLVGRITLYAQWKPKKYQVTYKPGPGFVTGDPVTEDAFFDQPQKLKPVSEMGWSTEGYALMGWATDDNGLLLEDQEEFVNLCGGLSALGDPYDAELTAQWVGQGQIVAAVTEDGVPKEVEPNEDSNFIFSLVKDTGETFVMPGTFKNGKYIFDPSEVVTPAGTPAALPPGNYKLFLNAKGYPEVYEEIEYYDNKPVSVIFDFYNVSLEPDPAYDDVHTVEMDGVTPVEGRHKALVPDDSKIKINTKVAAGYHFDGYSAAGTAPEWEGGDNMKAGQTVKVTGHSEIMAHVEANPYTVRFDANTKSPVIGKMEDQDMVYNEPQDLFKNTFQRSNAEFKGWNTRADGSGKAYKDGESVKNLTAENGGKVTLYAQWKEAPTKTALLTFDLNGGEIDGMTGVITTREIVGATISMPKAPKRSGYTFKYWKGSEYKPGDKYLVTGDHVFTAVWEEQEKKVKGVLTSSMRASGKTALKIAWKKVQNVSGYDIFLAKCDRGDKKRVCKKVKTIKGNKKFNWTRKGLKKGTSYKAYVKAYVMKDGKKEYVRTSPMVHAYTGGYTKKFTNAKSVSIKKARVSLKKGKTFKIKAKVSKLKKDRKLFPEKHTTKLRYMTSSKKVATVSKKGKIKAKGKGACTIYVFAHNGMSKQVKVTVK